ncbi:hypothetical protein BKA60DRAFT_585048 [Fusarium oxysporum]|nr:hypothetical protein BKA60DRAFT_585048 [Fusarium oxysporum]
MSSSRFEKRKAWTWEPENNLSISGDQILNEYHATIGGRYELFKQPGRIPREKRTRWATTIKFSSTSTKQ